MEQAIFSMLKGHQVLGIQSYKNLTIIPFSFQTTQTLDYVCLDTAFEKEYIKIREVNDSGSVPELFVENNSDVKILLLDGEELIGAKQNRIVNTTILLEKRTKTIIPVSCVEKSRWNYAPNCSEKPKEFRSSKFAMPAFSRTVKNREVTKSLERTKGKRFDSDQGKVWEDIEFLQTSFSVDSETRAMKDVFEMKENDINKYLENFTAFENQNGFIAVINGQPVGVEYISKTDVFPLLFNKILMGYIINAMLDVKKVESLDYTKNKEDFIAEICTLSPSNFKSVGLGNDIRLKSENVIATGLIVDKEVVHFVGLSGKEKELDSGNLDYFFNLRNSFIRRNK